MSIYFLIKNEKEISFQGISHRSMDFKGAYPCSKKENSRKEKEMVDRQLHVLCGALLTTPPIKPRLIMIPNGR